MKGCDLQDSQLALGGRNRLVNAVIRRIASSCVTRSVFLISKSCPCTVTANLRTPIHSFGIDARLARSRQVQLRGG